VLHGFEHNSSWSDGGTCRCYMSLVHVPDTFSWVCTCCNYVELLHIPITCPRYSFPCVYRTWFCCCCMYLGHVPASWPLVCGHLKALVSDQPLLFQRMVSFISDQLWSSYYHYFKFPRCSFTRASTVLCTCIIFSSYPFTWTSSVLKNPVRIVYQVNLKYNACVWATYSYFKQRWMTIAWQK